MKYGTELPKDLCAYGVSTTQNKRRNVTPKDRTGLPARGKGRQELAKMLDRLTPTQRRVIVARNMEGLRREVIAVELGVSAQEVRNIERKAMGRMRRAANEMRTA